jgi:hypothetical protein
MEIATGTAESHPTPLDYNPALSPATAPPTAVVMGQLSGPTVGARDTTGEYQAPLSALEGEIAAAQSAGHAAELGRRDHYSRDILPQGAAYGDDLPLPPVPADAAPAAYGYLGTGDEPLPSGA